MPKSTNSLCHSRFCSTLSHSFDVSPFMVIDFFTQRRNTNRIFFIFNTISGVIEKLFFLGFSIIHSYSCIFYSSSALDFPLPFVPLYPHLVFITELLKKYFIYCWSRTFKWNSSSEEDSLSYEVYNSCASESIFKHFEIMSCVRN